MNNGLTGRAPKHTWKSEENLPLGQENAGGKRENPEQKPEGRDENRFRRTKRKSGIANPHLTVI